MGTSEFQIDLQGLIKLLAKHLYAESDAFMREMLQNAHDSIKRRREWQGEGAPEGVIRVRIDREAATISFIDNGAGMTEEDVRGYLSTIGRSGTDAFRQELIQKGRDADVTVIGQFGIGLLSAFVVADRVVVETLSWESGHPAWRWESRGEKTYDLQPGERTDPGSTVTLFIADLHRDMLQVQELKQAIRKYADFLPVGIYVNEDETPTNAVNAPWHKSFNTSDDEVLEMVVFVARRFPDSPISTIPVHLRRPHRVDGVLYVSDNRIPDVNTTGLVDVYQSRMFVMEANRDLLPAWAKFVRGVIDSPDLTLTASRDAIQQDVIQKEIKEQLGQVVIDHLTQLAKDDPARFQQLCDWHHYHLKGMALRDDMFFAAVADLIPFETNQGPMNLSIYFQEARKRGQLDTDLLYFDERGSATQFYMLCESRGLLVVDASQVFEDDFLQRYGRLHPEIRLRQLNLGESDVIFESLSPDDHQEFRRLEMEFTRGMPDRRSVAKAVRFKPESVPGLVVLSEAAKRQAEMKAAAKNVWLPTEIRTLVKNVLEGERTIPVTLYLNADNPTIQQLAQMPPTETTRDACQAIYNNAIMLANQIITPQNAEIMFKSFSRVIDRMIDQTDKAKKLETQVTSLKLSLEAKERELKEIQEDPEKSQTEYVSCFFAMPFDEAYDPLHQAVKLVLEDRPYGWEVIRADERQQGTTVSENVRGLIRRSHCYLAEISEVNANVFLEIGRMTHYQDRPLIYLRREDAEEKIAADLGGKLYISYPAGLSVEALADHLRERFENNEMLQGLRSQNLDRYLSPDLLVKEGLFKRELSQTISKKYKTVEAFLADDPKAIAEKVGSRRGAIMDAQDHLKQYFDQYQ